MLRSPAGPVTRTVAPSAINTGGRSICGSAWARLPPSVATLRTRTFEWVSRVSAMTGAAARTFPERSISASRTIAPISIPPSAAVWMPVKAGPSRRRLTSRCGRYSPDFIISISAVPPAIARTPGSSGSSNAKASASEAGSSSANGLIAACPASNPAPALRERVAQGEARSRVRVFQRQRPSPSHACGVKLLGALAQGMYWFLVMRQELGIARGDLAALKGLRIGAAPWVEMGLRDLLTAAGLDPRRNDIHIGPVPGATGSSINFGLTAAQALERGEIDGFWANGMATEIAVTNGTGTIVLDVRRGDGPPGCFDYTMPVLAMRDPTDD